jgi:hypothetical protein
MSISWIASKEAKESQYQQVWQDQSRVTVLQVFHLWQNVHQTKGITFYRKRADENEILEVVALIAEGSCMSILLRLKGYKEDNIAAWFRQAPEYVEAIEERLM